MLYCRDPMDHEFKQCHQHHDIHELLVSVRQLSPVVLEATHSHLNITTDLLTRCISMMSLNIPFLY